MWASPGSVEFWAASLQNSLGVETHQVSPSVASAGCFTVVILLLVPLCSSQVVSYQLVGSRHLYSSSFTFATTCHSHLGKQSL